MGQFSCLFGGVLCETPKNCLALHPPENATQLPTPNNKQETTMEAMLNGLKLTVDKRTGGLLELSYPGVGTMLKADAAQSGLVDMACPIPAFEPMRVATRYSEGALVKVEEGCIQIHWDSLGANRGYAGIGGPIAATVTLKACDDGRSVVMVCHVDNRSKVAVPQVLFPDFMGLQPFAGEKETVFRTAGLAARPFVELKTPDRDYFYATRLGYSPNFARYTSGGMQTGESGMVLRWFDFGSLAGGFSLFPRRWGKDTRENIYLHLPEATGALRLMCEHRTTIEPGQSWDSPEYILTPHTHGWAKGIEPYRDWVRQHYRKLYPLPEHVRDGLGFRTVWMTQNAEHQKPLWHFRDLVNVARECRDHGLSEIVMWGVSDYTSPGFQPEPACGTMEEFKKAVADCAALGVRLTPFISPILAYGEKSIRRYGLKPGTGQNWTYHADLIPGFAPYYAHSVDSCAVDVSSPLWQQDVKDYFRQAMDCGVRSFCWDVFKNGYPKPEKPEPNIFTLTKELQAMMRQRDSQAAFSGEDVDSMEVNSAYLDYTWNWRESDAPLPASRIAQILEVQPLTSVLPTPRLNHNIDRSPLEAKRAFADNLFLNVWPRKPDDVNGSDLISTHPELSKALRQCAGLRKKFLAYFVNGTFISECVLTKPAANVQVRSYVLPDRLLTLVLNLGSRQDVSLSWDLTPWLPTTKRQTLTVYDENGKSIEHRPLRAAHGSLSVGSLEHGEMKLVEINE